MRIDDPLWPVVRETSRQILRNGDLHLKLPLEFKKEMECLLLKMSDYQPAKIEYPSFDADLRDDVRIYQRERESGAIHLIGYIGMLEPEPGVRWIKMPMHEGWKEVISACHELHAAGYPGCIGCGGPNSELPWDELKSRSRLQ